jgi:uncharacterized lipoprotein
MKKVVGLALIASSLLLLTGCGGTFRNRTYDYTRTDVQQLPPLKVPAGVTSPKFQPNLTVPPGPSNYAPSSMPIMTPPNYNDSYTIDKKTKLVTPVSSSGSAQAAATKPAVKTAVVSSKPEATAISKKLSSQLVRSTGNVPMLVVNAPYDITWSQMANALSKSGFRVVKAEKATGYYYIVIAGDTNNADAVMLYLKQNQAQTQVIMYNSAGNPDSSSNANLTLQQLSRNL